jgi:hypothetical protein
MSARRVMRRALPLMLAAALASGCAGVHIVKAPELAPRHQLEPGNRVRVHLVRPRSEVIGNVVRVAPDTLVIISEQNAPREIALSPANIERLELSRGQRSRAGIGALVGLLLGGVGGAFALGAMCEEGCIGAWPLLGLIPGGALVGAGIGAGVGSLIQSERWQPVTWP